MIAQVTHLGGTELLELVSDPPTPPLYSFRHWVLEFYFWQTKPLGHITPQGLSPHLTYTLYSNAPKS